MACSFIPRGCRPTRVNRGYRGCAAEIGCIVYQRPPLTILSQSLTYSGVNGIGWFTDGSLWLDMGHNFAKSQVLVVVVIPCHKSVPIRNLSTPPAPGVICVESLLVKIIMDIFSNHYFVSESVNSLFTRYFLR